MSFYTSIVDAYDQLFPLNQEQEALVERQVGTLSGKRLLDAGCGTGSLAISLGRKGARVDAFDLDEEMVNMAQKKKPQALDVNFSTDNLLTFTNTHKAGFYDMVCCFGNTLVHLNSLDEVEKFISNASEVLKDDNAVLAIQIVNYDRILQKNIKRLPLIETPNYTFKRFYKHEEGKIEFLTTLTDVASGEEIKNSQILLPVLVEDLMDIMAKYFVFVEAVASFQEEMWTDNGFHTIVIASR